MTRALVIVLDSVGIGGAPDGAAYGDGGADTLGHIAEACAEGRGDRPGLRAGPLRLPHLAGLGLGLAAREASGRMPPGLAPDGPVAGAWGHAVETARGKDTVSGHWEIAGAPVDFDWGRFPATRPSFPPDLTRALIEEGNLPGILGDCHASGTAVIEAYGAEHLRSGKPICYTSVDSVFQIAAHEEAFGLERLYALCGIARRLCDPYRIGRVIARPFAGSAGTGFVRTANRRDFATPPPGDTLLDRLAAAGRPLVSVGKIGDIFAHRHTGTEVKPAGNDACLDAALAAFADLGPGGLVFANLVDFDTEYGHRRDVPGYAAALERFDARLPEIRAALRPGDLCLVTADHGNDPTWTGTDHTREQVPVLAFGPGQRPGPIGRREGLADIGATVAAHLGLALPAGRSWL
ncbi:phosphopentomutase [Methylobacterium sp. 4-46]|uniref:Phosphopentomutase n=1 Tax=Methylobacterium sp. (strain 4-46) TaxID=426117 RepID=DEOB_METS4|nr:MULTISPECIES: phosphopentomutase [Methylobacterium]B0UPC1.1 RecName: Full=Phosphopentomutase; AltName: Full=Phosphodeoxyribomutase [Methylobacterium sp. 4-46]ACA18862.1 phosphopentomutase [Methylobacterium sp. 4-46]WFT78087.1 phosphopentomutase [Methylobacterium nodulans]